MTTNPFFAGTADLALRMRQFNKFIAKESEIQLFELFHNITTAQKTASTGNAEGQTEDLLLKSNAVEAEISRHNHGNGLTRYNDWLAGGKAKSE
jgi:hypothetical protein